MGWFTVKSSNRPARPDPKRASLASTPNVYISPSPLPAPTTNQISQYSPACKDRNQVFTHHHPSTVQPQFSPAAYNHQATLPTCPRYSKVHIPLHNAQPVSPPSRKCQTGYCSEPIPSKRLIPYRCPLPPDAKILPNRAVTRKTRNSISDLKGKGYYPSQTAHIASSVIKGTYFSKVELYANSKLPSTLPSLQLHTSSWLLLDLAAQYSQHVYSTPSPHERDAHIFSSLLSGTKAMRIKSVSMDRASTIVFAIRGTASFSDWAVNLNTAPSPPTNFLDDPRNLCHAGFLSTARKMIKPVAARLRQLLKEDPSRAGHSLLMTGHSAGGAIAALLYSHMQSETKSAESELTILAGHFKRIHCVTFGAPPVSLLPLEKPSRRQLKKSLFLSFINEGDPVARADKAYVKSLLELLTKPPPNIPQVGSGRTGRHRHPQWKVPPTTLRNAGKIVILKTADPRALAKDYKTIRERLREGVLAVTCKEEELRSVIWGDPVAHMMSLYTGRMKILAREGSN